MNSDEKTTYGFFAMCILGFLTFCSACFIFSGGLGEGIAAAIITFILGYITYGLYKSL